jgi:hypothetical protein
VTYGIEHSFSKLQLWWEIRALFLFWNDFPTVSLKFAITFFYQEPFIWFLWIFLHSGVTVDSVQLHSHWSSFRAEQCCFLDKENFITYGVTVLHFNSFTDHKCVLKQALGDAYGLLMHRNGQWEWTLAPGVSPSTRYQHAAVSDH